MATSYANYTGGYNTASAIYTVPIGKVAKIIITNIQMINSNTINIGNYKRANNQTGLTRSWYGTHQGTSNGNAIMGEEEGMMALHQYTQNMDSATTYLKRTHILLAGESIYFTTGNIANSISFTVIEEDV